MIIEKLCLRNFRNYESLNLEFSPKLNIIVGPNASGKTNIVEAIHYLSLARSFRTQESVDLIKHNASYALIEARIVEDGVKKNLSATILPKKKQIRCNDKIVPRLSELARLINVIVFEPRNSLMFKDSPSVRRDYLDINISKKTPVYLAALMRYEKLLKERNKILKEDEVDLLALDVVTLQMIKESEIIARYRLLYIAKINQVLPSVMKNITGENIACTLQYLPFVEVNGDYQKLAKKAYQKALDADIKKKVTSLGVHREDFVAMIKNKDVASFGSQGENRMFALGLILCPYFLIDDKGKKPIVVLDDVMSELDANHQNKLLEFLKKFEQVFVTATKTNVKSASIYEVKNNTVKRRNA